MEYYCKCGIEDTLFMEHCECGRIFEVRNDIESDEYGRVTSEPYSKQDDGAVA